MGASLATNVTLHNGVKHMVRADDLLIVAQDCYDISDKALVASRIKHLSKGDKVIVKDVYRTMDGTFQAVRVWFNHTLYWLASGDLTLLSLA